VFTVRSGEELDADWLQEIERLAGERFREVGMAEVADDEPPPLHQLRRSATDGRCWVTVGTAGKPVGYVTVSEVDGHAHVDQMSVLPDHQGMGAGRALIERVRVWAVENRLEAITLTTFSDVPWNRPLYEHLGFRVLDEGEIGGQLRAIREAERARGLDLRPRVCMVLDLGGSSGALTSS
jgi:GNAT superfamily N-acetyltransferase